MIAEFVFLTAMYLCSLHEEGCLNLPNLDPTAISALEEGYNDIVLAEVLEWQYKMPHMGGKIRDSVVLALIRVESEGDPYARRTGSPYWGLLQISDAYAYDAYEYKGMNPRKARSLHGNGEESLRVFYWFMLRYAFLHEWDPYKVATLHKVGPTALKRILDRERENPGLSFRDSVCEDSIPGSCAYLKRFERFWSGYRSYLRDHVAYGKDIHNSFMISL